MFPIINQLSDLVPHIEHDPQIRVKVEHNGFTVVCYMLQDEETFTSGNQDFARECRGITFAPDGKIAARTLHKFFNLGEKQETQLAELPWDTAIRVMEKRDGSMVTPVLMTPRSFKFKTKKSFETPEASLADSIAKNAEYQLWILHLLQAGLTPTFEITSPKFPIVLLYEKDELTLLHIRENITGRYLTEAEMKFLNPPMPLVANVTKEFSDFFGGIGENPNDPSSAPHFEEGVCVRKLMHAAETREGIEGWIVQFESGDMIKIKTKWYINLHHSVTFTRWRDVARAIIADQHDDLKGAFAMCGRSIEPIEFIARSIHNHVTLLKNAVEAVVEQGRNENLTVKDMALKHKDLPTFGLIMRMFRGSDINWMEYYEKNFLDTWSLEVIPVNGAFDASTVQQDLA